LLLLLVSLVLKTNLLLKQLKSKLLLLLPLKPLLLLPLKLLLPLLLKPLLLLLLKLPLLLLLLKATNLKSALLHKRSNKEPSSDRGFFILMHPLYGESLRLGSCS
jgi:hypothetical protein